MRNNWLDFVDSLFFIRGRVDISSLFTEEKESNTNKVTVRKATKEEIENMTFDEYEDVTYERINQ